MAGEPNGIRARWADSQAEITAKPRAYAPTTELPVLRARLFDREGRWLLWVWTDGAKAAGSLYARPPSPDDALGDARRRAKRFVFQVMARLAAGERPPTAVLDPAYYEPDYRLSEIERAPAPVAP